MRGATLQLACLSMLTVISVGGCREHVNRLPQSRHLLTRIHIVELAAPEPRASLGSMTGAADPFDDPFSAQSSSLSMDESLFLETLLRATPKDEVQKWFVGAFSEAMHDNFRDIKVVGADACDARLTLEILTYGVFAASLQSPPEVQFSAEARMESCEGNDGLWRFSATKAEALPRGAAGTGFQTPGRGAGQGPTPTISDENMTFIVERLAAGTGVKIAQQMRRDADSE